jgi:hypothetical protein
LPTTVNVTLSDSTNQTVSVSWDNGTPNYDANTQGNYVFSGTLTFSGNITNTNNFKASVNVIVAPQPASSATGDIIHDAASGLLNGVVKLVNWILASAFNAVSSVPVVQKAGASLAQASSALALSVSSDIKLLLEPFSGWFKQ